MQIFGKTLKEYWQASKKFLIIYLVLIVAISVARLFLNFTRVNTAFRLANIVVLWAGLEMARKHKFNRKQTFVVGVLMSLMNIWSLFIFDPIKSIPLIIVINGVIYGFLAVIGGIFVRTSKKNK